MLKAVLLTLLAGGILVHCRDSNVVCDGTYKVDSLQKCDNPEQYKFDINASKRKMNRTHDALTITCDMPTDFTVNFGVAVDIYIKCDGGYKLSDTYAFPSLCGTMKQYIKTEFESALTLGGYDPPDCPLPQGLLNVVDFVVDNRNLPKETICGNFKYEIYILEGLTKVSCVTVYLTVSALEDDEED